MAELSQLRLQDFEALQAFEEIAKDAGVEIILHGGAAFRAALYAAYHDRLDMDLFDLAPFTSDFDLEHDGSPKQTAAIAGYIDALVPFASWCRWSINDAERAARAAAQRRASTDVPVRRIRFSTAAPTDVPERAQLDIEQRRITFERNPDFRRRGPDIVPDLELFGLMIALNSWAEAEEIADGRIAFDEEGARSWIDEGLDEDARKLIEQPAVAARFWHLFSLRMARRGADEFNVRLLRLGQPILTRFDLSFSDLTDSDRAIAVSKITHACEFRVPQLAPRIATGEAAGEVFGTIIRKAARLAGHPEKALPADPLDLIDPTLDLIGIVPDITLLPYGAAEQAAGSEDPFLSRAEQEFAEFAWDVPGSDTLDPHALTGQMLALGASDSGAATALPVVGGTFGRRRAWLRARLDDLIDRGKDGSPVEAALLILQAQPDEGERTGPAPGLRRHSVPGDIPVERDRPSSSEPDEVEPEAEAEQPAYQTVTT